jgi:hypothetical protein
MTKSRNETYPATKKVQLPIPYRHWDTVHQTELWSKDFKSVWIYCAEEFDERVVKHGTNCWDWLGAWHRQGYGMVTVLRPNDHIKSPKMTTQRLAMAIELGRALDDNERVASTCRNLACTNPDHLFITDYKHQGDHIDYAVAFKNRKKKYNQRFFELNKSVLEELGAVRLAYLFGVTRGRGIAMKRAYLRWKAEQALNNSN